MISLGTFFTLICVVPQSPSCRPGFIPISQLRTLSNKGTDGLALYCMATV